MSAPISPRRLGVAFLLSLLMPGLGHLYCGQTRQGLLIWGATFAALAAAVVAWGQLVFVPWLPALVLVFAWTLLQLWLLADRRRFVLGPGRDYRLAPGNHWLSYVAVFLGLGVLPTTIAGGWLLSRVGSVSVRSHAMFPALLPGDRLLVDRDAFREQPPREGDLVVLEGRQGAVVARVIATGGQTVHLRDGRPFIDGAIAAQQALVSLRVARFDPGLRAELASLRGYREQRGGRSYVVTYASDLRRPDPAPVTLGAQEIYVLGDNRDAALAEQVFGRIEVAAVAGRPAAVWLSVDEAGEPRSGRVGVRVR